MSLKGGIEMGNPKIGNAEMENIYTIDKIITNECDLIYTCTPK